MVRKDSISQPAMDVKALRARVAEARRRYEARGEETLVERLDRAILECIDLKENIGKFFAQIESETRPTGGEKTPGLPVIKAAEAHKHRLTKFEYPHLAPSGTSRN